MRVSDYLCDQLLSHDLKQVFMLTGGGAMHLNDAFARENRFNITCLHHEQSMGMAAEGYTRTCGRSAIVNVTTGPGGINVLNGVFGAFVDSVKMLIVSGQVKTETIARFHDKTLRQLGDQEVDIFSIASSTVKYIAMPKNAEEAIISIHEALNYLYLGRDGPVWIDIPVDVQSAQIDEEQVTTILNNSNIRQSLLKKIHPNVVANKSRKFSDVNSSIDQIKDAFSKAERPIIMIGNGVRLSGKLECFLSLVELLSIPVVTGWNAHDILPTSHRLFAGKPGTIGDRAGNFSVYNADFILILGCRMNIRQISYNWRSFGKFAKIAMVDIDISELNKPTLALNMKLHLPLEIFLPALKKAMKKWKPKNKHMDFLAWCKSRLDAYPVLTKQKLTTEHNINPYAFFSELYKQTDVNDVIVLANGTACVIGNQSIKTEGSLRVFTNSGCASMGYDLPASIGASLALKGSQRVICVAGDGSIMQNIQELAVIAHKKLPIKIFILANNGYHSIRQTQKNYFPGNEVGTGNDDGLSIPDFEKILPAFGIAISLVNDFSTLKRIFKSERFNSKLPTAYIIELDQSQNFEPKLQSRIEADGTMKSPELHDMYPFLEPEEMKSNILT